MTERLIIHPANPQDRLISQAVSMIEMGGIVAYPTDSAYALGCQLGDNDSVERIKRLRQLDKNHHFTLVCHNLSQIATYAQVDNTVFRLLKAYTPGPYTFILNASKEVPRRLMHPKRKTIGLRVPNNKIALSILKVLEKPLMSVTLILADEELALADPDEIFEQLEGKIEVFVDGGPCGIEPTTVIDLTSNIPKILREGKGDISGFC